MGKRPKEGLGSSGSQNGTSLDRSLELAATAILARTLFRGITPPVVMEDDGSLGRRIFESGVAGMVFGPTNIDSIPPGNPRLIASLGMTEIPSTPRENRNGKGKGPQRRRAA